MNQFALGVEIEINHDCNRACAYCPNAKHERPEKGDMDRGLFTRLMGQLRDIEYRGRISYHFYNEPLLSPNLESYVGLTKEYLPRSWIEIYTNGTLLDEARLDGLLKLGVDKFTVTHHAGSNISAFEAAYTKLPDRDRAKIKRHVTKDLIFTSRGGLMNAGPRISKPLDLPCLIPTSLMVVTRNGHVLPCYEDYFQKNSMGNIAERHVAEIWNSPKYVEFRRKLKERRRAEYPVCSTCNNRLVIT